MSTPQGLTLAYAEAHDGYARIHTHPINRALHGVGIPIIVAAVLAAARTYAGADASWLLLLAVTLFCARWGSAAAAAMAGMGLVCSALHWLRLDGPSLLALFVFGWVVQGLGHTFERASPEFVQRPSNLLLGPVIVALEWWRMLRRAAAAMLRM